MSTKATSRNLYNFPMNGLHVLFVSFMGDEISCDFVSLSHQTQWAILLRGAPKVKN